MAFETEIVAGWEREWAVRRFKCAASTAAGGCKYSYKFSTGIGADKPAKEFLPADPSAQVNPPGLAGGNPCKTQAGKEPVVEVISNQLSNASMKVDFKAQSNCKCAGFVVYADPADSGKKNSPASAPANDTGAGFVIIPKEKTTQLKAKCDGLPINDTCKGTVKDIQISITTN